MNSRVIYPIPAGTDRSCCTKCREPIYLVLNAKGFRKAVDVRDEGTIAPSPKRAGEGHEHRCAPTTPQRNGR